MVGSLDWQSNTNVNSGSRKTVNCSCLEFWELLQQQAIIRLSNLKDAKSHTYHLEPGYEARARRIASVYAKLYLEQETDGTPHLKGRYYWMGLGAFASKTVAYVFNHYSSVVGYEVGVTEAIDLFAAGNLWLFMDISVWHYAWNSDPASFNCCKTQRDLSQFKHIKKSIQNLPWSKVLPTVKQLRITSEINDAFSLLDDIEQIFNNPKFKTRKSKFNKASESLFDHLVAIAKQEQGNILQPVVWNNSSVQTAAALQRYVPGTPNATLVLASDYEVNAVKKDWSGRYRGRNAALLAQLKEEAYSEPLPGTIAENYDSRMKWILKAAQKYHNLMQDDDGRLFLEKELQIIAGWGNSQANFTVSPNSNDGKN